MLGSDWTVVAVAGSVCPPEVKLVEVAVTFQPAPDPVASPTSNASVAVTDCWVPFRIVAGNVTVAAGVLLMNDELPALNVTEAVVAASAAPGSVMLTAAATATSVASVSLRLRSGRRSRAVFLQRLTG